MAAAPHRTLRLPELLAGLSLVTDIGMGLDLLAQLRALPVPA
jgi:hypothetical protein